MNSRSSLISIILIFIISQSLRAQHKLNYTVFRNGNEIGNIEVSQFVDNNEVKYDVNSEVSFRVIWKYTRVTKIGITVKDNHLTSSYAKTWMDGDLDDFSESFYRKDQLWGVYHPDDTVKIERPVNFSSLMLYFEEPDHLNEVFAESYLKFCQLKNLGDHQYRLFLPGGKENTYTYENGRLVNVFIDRTWFNLNFKLRQETSLQQE